MLRSIKILDYNEVVLLTNYIRLIEQKRRNALSWDRLHSERSKARKRVWWIKHRAKPYPKLKGYVL